MTANTVAQLRQGVGYLLLISGVVMMLFRWYRSFRWSFLDFKGHHPLLDDNNIPRNQALLVLSSTTLMVIGFMILLFKEANTPISISIALFFAGSSYINLRWQRHKKLRYIKAKQDNLRFGTAQKIRIFTEHLMLESATIEDKEVKSILWKALHRSDTSNNSKQVEDFKLGLEQALILMDDQYSEELRRDTETAVNYCKSLLMRPRRTAIVAAVTLIFPFLCLFVVVIYVLFSK